MPDDGHREGDGRVEREDGVEAAERGSPEPAQERVPAQAVADERDAELARANARIDELLRAYAALVDEQKAFRGRAERERQRVLEAERAQVAQALLESMDELERALAAIPAELESGPTAPLVQGVRLALAALGKRVAEMGAERLAVVGQPFDPRVAEAVDVVPVPDGSRDEIVVDEVRAGYRIGDRILRPARVRVGRAARA